MSKKVAIVQSNYIPWKGYFDFINYVDEFILFDDVQYTRRDWRNRNRIKTPEGLKWLTIPVEVKGKYTQLIRETKVAEHGWPEKHWKTLVHSYSKSPFFSNFEEPIKELYEKAAGINHLSEINRMFITSILGWLGSSTVIKSSPEYGVIDGKNERLIDLCLKAGATCYVSGAAAKGYLDEGLFNKQGIQVEWMDYSGYLEYEQLYGDFEHSVSIFDLLFSVGSDFGSYMKH